MCPVLSCLLDVLVSCLTRLWTRFGRTKVENCDKRPTLAKASTLHTVQPTTQYRYRSNSLDVLHFCALFSFVCVALHCASLRKIQRILYCNKTLSVGPLARADENKNTHFAEEARKTRLQLVRARKDLRELWLERDELAMLAGQAIQVRELRELHSHSRLHKKTHF